MTIKISTNRYWLNPAEYARCKYAPVVVDKNCGIRELTEIKNARKEQCRGMMADSYSFPDVPRKWRFSRNDHDASTALNANTVPVFVTSSDASSAIAAYLKDTSKPKLAWAQDPSPIKYIFVHDIEFDTYKKNLSTLFARGRPYVLVGWSGGALTGFGAARAAVLSLASELRYSPQRIVMMDHDVLDKRLPAADIKKKHDSGKTVVGLGKGAPTRVTGLTQPGRHFDPGASPTQQHVSLKAPYTYDQGKAYAIFMVAGGEDMAMSKKLGHFEPTPRGGVSNQAIVKATIDKVDLGGRDGNTAMAAAKLATLQELYKREKDIPVEFNGRASTVGAAAQYLKAELKKRVKQELAVEHVSSLIVERILLARYLYSKNIRNADKKAMEEEKFIDTLMNITW